MCGIVGLINCGDKKLLEKMSHEIAHRGPDDEGIEWFQELNSGLGHRRLSIIDLSPKGHQPMFNDTGNLCITFNGEIYNYFEIRKELEKVNYRFRSNSDTEVILKSYEQWGEKCLNKFNGMFAFAILDLRKKKLFAARDRVGIKPFYYYHNDNKFIFASEIKSIIASDIYKKEPDYDILYNPSRFVLSPYTGFKNIYKLPAGHYLIFDFKQLKIEKFWDIYPSEQDISNKEAVEKLDHLLNDAVQLQMISDVEVGVLLSGGLDSSIISALMRKNSTKDIYSFTIKFSERDKKFQKNEDDSYYAKKIAEKFGFIHKEIEINPDIENLIKKIIWNLDEPIADPAAINTFLISKYARENNIYVLLNGMGGDEIFAGYREQLACLLSDTYQKYVTKHLQNFLINILKIIPVASKNQGFKNLRILKRFLSFSSYPRYERFLLAMNIFPFDVFQSLYKNKVKIEDSYFYHLQKDYFNNSLSYLTQICYNNSKVFLTEHNLNYSDKSSMAIGVEGRPPLTDHRIIEFMFSLKPKFRINGFTQKYLLKKVAEKYLPKEIIYRPKAPFSSPLRSWVKGPLNPIIEKYLSKERLNKYDLYDYDIVKTLINNDRKSFVDNSIFIWQILTTQIWFETFFD